MSHQQLDVLITVVHAGAGTDEIYDALRGASLPGIPGAWVAEASTPPDAPVDGFDDVDEAEASAGY